MSGKGKWIFGGFAAFIVIGAMATQGEDASTTPASPKPSASASASAASAAPTMAEQFKANVEKNGTAQEKDAMKHVVKVQGADEQNDILDSVEIHTDLKGDMVSGDTGTGKLIASAFADWKDSKNGLVTVYNDSGDILSNGNF